MHACRSTLEDPTIGPQAAQAVETAVRRSSLVDSGFLPTATGIAALLVGATTVFAQLQSSLNDFWGVTARPSRNGLVVFLATRLESLGLVLVIGLLLLTSFVITMTITALLQFTGAWVPIPAPIVAGLNVAASLSSATLLFAMIFKILPDVELHWRDMWWGAFITALLFVVGQTGISLYLTRAAPASMYGAAGSLVLVLFWVYYSSLILLFGAAVTRAAIRHRGDRIVPKLTAVRVRRELLEEAEDGAMTRVKTID